MLVVNTCAFIDSAKQESIDTILEMAQHKKDGACQAARRHRLPGRAVPRRAARRRFRKSTPCSAPVRCRDIVGAIAERPGATASSRPAPLSAVTLRGRQIAATRGPQARAPGEPVTRGLPTYIYDATPRAVLATPRHYAYVKIAEGCDYKCAFCIIPTLRGAYRSRPSDSIVGRGARAGRARRQGAAADLPGHDVLRHRPRRSAARSRACCAS